MKNAIFKINKILDNINYKWQNFIEDMFQDASCYATKSSEKNSFDVVEKDSNEESVVKVEKPNNIILPDNN